MFRTLKINKKVFRQSCFCLALFFAAFSFFAVSGTILPEVELRQSSGIVSNSQLAAFPGKQADDEAAVRWNYNCRVNFALRLDKGSNLRTTVPMHGNGVELHTALFPALASDIKVLSHNQPSKTYYRRLWQKILPSRAGPCA
jgi:hypothetical protein